MNGDNILIVDDDVTFALMLKTWLGKHGFDSDTVSSVAAAKKRFKERDYSIVLTDMRLPDSDGIDLLQWMSVQKPGIPVIVMTNFAEIQNAVNSMKLGAFDYLSKPVNPSELLDKISEALKHTSKADSVDGTQEPAVEQVDFIEGNSDASKLLYQYVNLVAPTNMSVLICGESGTGKEHIAHLIHSRSKRSGKPFVAIDCGSIPAELAGSEFFGHTKGSFTGALSDKIGAFEAANGGTVFLDEVGNLGYETQMHLLRALQERKIKRIGSNKEIEIDIRLVAATNEDLEKAISKGAFRNDLYHRISEFTIHMPELKDLKQDIMLYANFFLDSANRELGKNVIGFDDNVMQLFLNYDWPGNLRQMKNTVMRATLLTQGEYITMDSLPRELSLHKVVVEKSALLHDPADEKERILSALKNAGGNKSMAAKLLGVDRKTLYNKLKLYDIE
ncbi:MAG: sigma-54-dependent Fis family transcriptional regulator [Bacteroidetes bacterium]|uniref:Sigma-54-dependent Fis family transcriptional regulator n=1 Tax=Candidatus Limisoma faecipullorum TaxID=2840854 RepID=A0A9D9IRM1_9BACT|nr:sigma-54-dependent Fis family transcriptional regulator [Candidatus Limisoma faecipullorum]